MNLVQFELCVYIKTIIASDLEKKCFNYAIHSFGRQHVSDVTESIFITTFAHSHQPLDDANAIVHFFQYDIL